MAGDPLPGWQRFRRPRPICASRLRQRRMFPVRDRTRDSLDLQCPSRCRPESIRATPYRGLPELRSVPGNAATGTPRTSAGRLAQQATSVVTRPPDTGNRTRSLVPSGDGNGCADVRINSRPGLSARQGVAQAEALRAIGGVVSGSTRGQGGVLRNSVWSLANPDASSSSAFRRCPVAGSAVEESRIRCRVGRGRIRAGPYGSVLATAGSCRATAHAFPGAWPVERRRGGGSHGCVAGARTIFSDRLAARAFRCEAEAGSVRCCRSGLRGVTSSPLHSLSQEFLVVGGERK